MNKKTRSIFYWTMIVVLLTSIVFIFGCDDDDDLPCVNPLVATDQSPTGYACYSDCGSPAECDRMVPGGKGKGCNVGQVCNDQCTCFWVDRDLDSSTTTSCTGNNKWINLGEVDVLSGENQEWVPESKVVNARSLSIIQTQGLTVTQIFSVEVYDTQGLYETYDYSQEPFKLAKANTFSKSFDLTIDITKVVVNWDDGNKSNKARLEVFVGTNPPDCDCDDNDPTTYPFALEICDNKDNDCDGIIDEGGVCEKNIYLCKTDNFVRGNEGQGKNLSYGHCKDDTWCSNEITGNIGTCTYDTKEEDIGQQEFYTYVCDFNTCWKFTKGIFMVCGHGWNCTSMCNPGECNYDSKEWCNTLGIWQTKEWCHSECGKADSECGGNCKQGSCDISVKKWCDKGYWFDEDYCNCDICGTEDSSCPGCICEDGTCDTINDKYCDQGIWKSDAYCWAVSCCLKDYDCYIQDVCSTCASGTCDTKNNKYCLSSSWTSEDYCENCELYDYGCGSGPCKNKECDTVKRLYCDEGKWINPGASYCFPGYCGSDPSCECLNEKDNCCLGEIDDACDPDCTEISDVDCAGCTPNDDHCCDDSAGNRCDEDCIFSSNPLIVVDPDCSDACTENSDDCCSGPGDNTCDPDCTENSDPDCEDTCTIYGGDCCISSSGDICDPDCVPREDPDCAAHPCDENWVCEQWDTECDGVNEQHTCLSWKDINDCNTFFEKPEGIQDCHKEFTCEPDDDKDKDGYPSRACYDAVNDIVLEDLDCDDGDASQKPEAEEVCNGEDDNCDDSIDEDCPCTSGETKECGKNEGICRTGIQSCINGYFSICGGPGYVPPGKEGLVCNNNGLDDNCDGYIDENCGCEENSTQECGSDIGICKKGWQACHNLTYGSFCNEEVKPGTETCGNTLDDDCDGLVDGEDSSCQQTTPAQAGPAHCSNKKQDEDETGRDCGGADCTPCPEKPAACAFGQIKEKCTCGKAAYTTGYCCNQEYRKSECLEQPKDSDEDGCLDDEEAQLGTDMMSSDTDGDGYLDCDNAEKLPLCNEDGICDIGGEYPETLENCQKDCKEGVGIFTWIILILIILALIGIGGYLYAKHKGYKLPDILKKIKLSNFIKIKKKEKEEKPLTFTFRKEMPKKEPLTTEQPVKPKEPITKGPVKELSSVKLRAIINSYLRRGYTKLQIKQEALKAGWPAEEIDKALKGKKSSYKLLK